jgi:hypothetical protein
MKKTLGIWVCTLVLFASSGFAATEMSTPQNSVQDFASKKADILKRMDEREQIMLQRHKEARACVEAAQNDNDLRTCREKIRADHKGKRDNFRR